MRNRWPWTEFDSDCNDHSNLMHIMTTLEGYRDRIMGKEIEEYAYSPGSARDSSYRYGWEKADADLRKPVPKITIRGK